MDAHGAPGAPRGDEGSGWGSFIHATGASVRGPALCLALLAALMLTACAGHAPRTPPPTLLHHGPPVTVEPVDVLALTPEMEAFLDRFVRPYRDPDVRVELLARAITDSSMLGFHYDEALTLTAAEAFHRRSGNCVAYANLVVALARASGIEASYQEVRQEAIWSGTGDTVLVPKHINIVLRTRRGRYLMDTLGIEPGRKETRKSLSDGEALSLYHNNLGAEALLDRDLSRAFAQLVRAIEVAPNHPDAWVNLGVVYGRNVQFDEAEFAYRSALDIDAAQISALSNLYDVFLVRGKEEEAAAVARRVERYRQRNPYHLLHLAETALEEGQPASARDLMERAVDIKEDEYRFHATLAQAYWLLGDSGAATASLEQARLLAPSEAQPALDRTFAEHARGPALR